MDDLRELYQQLIIDHGRKPRNFGVMENATYVKEGFNPLCGDRLTLYLKCENQKIIEAKFSGQGCAISMASASLMTEALKGKTLTEAQELFEQFHHLVTDQPNDKSLMTALGKLAVLAGVAQFPARVKCATLAWHTMHNAITNESGRVTTEE